MPDFTELLVAIVLDIVVGAIGWQVIKLASESGDLFTAMVIVLVSVLFLAPWALLARSS